MTLSPDLIYSFEIGTVAAVAAILGSMLGLGGGVFLVPILTLFFGIDPKFAVGASAVVVVTNSVVGSTNHLRIRFTNPRLAMLLQAGVALEPSRYCLDPRPMPLIDNTAVLHRALGLSDEAYLAFVARGLTAEPVADLAALRAVASAKGPAAVAELEGVLRAHGRDLSEVGR